MLIPALALQAPLGPAAVDMLQGPTQSEPLHQRRKPTVIGQVRPQFDECRHARPPATVPVQYVKPPHGPLDRQAIAPKPSRLAVDIDPA